MGSGYFAPQGSVAEARTGLGLGPGKDIAAVPWSALLAENLI